MLGRRCYRLGSRCLLQHWWDLIPIRGGSSIMGAEIRGVMHLLRRGRALRIIKLGKNVWGSDILNLRLIIVTVARPSCAVCLICSWLKVWSRTIFKTIQIQILNCWLAHSWRLLLDHSWWFVYLSDNCWYRWSANTLRSDLCWCVRVIVVLCVRRSIIAINLPSYMLDWILNYRLLLILIFFNLSFLSNRMPKLIVVKT